MVVMIGVNLVLLAARIQMRKKRKKSQQPGQEVWPLLHPPHSKNQLQPVRVLGYPLLLCLGTNMA